MASLARKANGRIDAPDHIEELVISHGRRRRHKGQRSASAMSAPIHQNIAQRSAPNSTVGTPSSIQISQQRSVSAMSAASSTSGGPIPQSLQKSQSMIQIGDVCVEVSPTTTAKLSPLTMFPPKGDGSAKSATHSTHRRRSRQQSPHPADVANNQYQLVQPQTNNIAMVNSSKEEYSGTSGHPPNFTISNNLQSSESAEELRHLIDAMQTEFKRLRASKMQAEARAEQLETDLAIARADKLQADLGIQKQEMKERLKSLSAENERLKRHLGESKIQAGQMAGKAFRLERENKIAQEAEARADELQTELNIQHIQHQKANKRIESLTTENERLKGELGEGNAKLHRMAGRIKQLENENKLLKVDTAQLQRALEVLLPKKGNATMETATKDARRKGASSLLRTPSRLRKSKGSLSSSSTK